jgi:anaerobic nitric oxide reductase flavorubredoxin
MTEAIEISPRVFWIGTNDRTTDLFEGMWPITQEGVTYNTYLVNGQKKALIDLTKSLKGEDLLRRIDGIMDIAALDYIVINHMEPDHTGVIRLFQRLAPRAVILCTEKAKTMLASFYGITERIQVVRDGETISLGDMELKFIDTPFVHWPETMMTYEPKNQIVFSCDGFGGYGAFEGAIFDDECVSVEYYEKEALRYYTNIVAKFSRPVLKAIEKLKSVPIRIIAPSHGLIWRAHPQRIVDLYAQWARYAIEPAKPEVTLLYASMYGNTETMMNAVAQGVSRSGVPLQIFDVARTHASYILPSLWTRQGVIIGAPTYEGHLFPAMANLMGVAEEKHIANRKAAYFGSYGWHGGAQTMFQKLAEPLQWQILENLTFIGNPTLDELKAGEEFGVRFARAVQQSDGQEKKNG